MCITIYIYICVCIYIYIYTHVWVYLAITRDNIRLELVTTLPLDDRVRVRTSPRWPSSHLHAPRICLCWPRSSAGPQSQQQSVSFFCGRKLGNANRFCLNCSGLSHGPYSTSPTYSRSLDLVRGQFRHLYVVRIYGAIHLSSTNNFTTSADKAYFFHQGV